MCPQKGHKTAHPSPSLEITARAEFILFPLSHQVSSAFSFPGSIIYPPMPGVPLLLGSESPGLIGADRDPISQDHCGIRCSGGRVPEPDKSERTVTPAPTARTKALADPTPITRNAFPAAENPYCQPPVSRAPTEGRACSPLKSSLAALPGEIQQDTSSVLNLTLQGAGPLPPLSWQRSSPQQSRQLPLPI